MSQLEDDVPPTGEQLHMPSPSLLPVLLAVGLALALVGVTVSIILTIVGLLITIPVIVLWIRSARDETAELPPGH
jgi:Flp pilus assembly protein TadB